MKEQEMLEKEYNIALNIVKKVLGADLVDNKMRKVVDIGISPRAVRRNGVCYAFDRGLDKVCKIELSRTMFNCTEHDRINTLIHEILHTFIDTKGHNEMWQYYANLINQNTDFNIKRCNNFDKGINESYKYKITCKKCGRVHYQYKLSNHRKYCYINHYMMCGKCRGTDFSVEDIKLNKKIC